jgi:hypothetical protein
MDPLQHDPETRNEDYRLPDLYRSDLDVEVF